MPICRFHARGHCRKGSNCNYTHVDNVVVGTSTRVCKFYAQGHCRNGDRCSFVHVDHEVEDDDEEEEEEEEVFTDTEDDESDRWIVYRALRPGEADDIKQGSGILRGSPPGVYNRTALAQHLQGVPPNLRKKNPWVSGTYCRDVATKAQGEQYKHNSGAHGVAKIYLNDLDPDCIHDVSTRANVNAEFSGKKKPPSGTNFAIASKEVCMWGSIPHGAVRLLRSTAYQFEEEDEDEY
eukprot:TRINITY_DN28668_c1_g1_i1.p1 TRINITY_DN28668_c1_g1~~TRINITY_DN28668_c1_g1_i1.p1  ORF type:complete len:254 (+),score=39.64 TRINITY_DN28668_c1_g1_i1:55-762(+)